MPIVKKNLSEIIFILLLSFSLILSFNYQAILASGQVERELTADKITISTEDDGGDVLAEGNVLLVYDRMELRSREARFNPETKDILMTGEVKIKTEEYRITAGRMEGTLEPAELYFEEEATLTGTELYLMAENLTYNQAQDSILARGNPELEYKDLRVKADRITYNPEEETALFEGNVRGEQNGQSFSGDRLTAHLAEEEILLSGKARLSFPGE